MLYKLFFIILLFNLNIYTSEELRIISHESYLKTLEQLNILEQENFEFSEACSLDYLSSQFKLSQIIQNIYKNILLRFKT